MDSDHEITDSTRPLATPTGARLTVAICCFECSGELPPSFSGLQVLDLLRGAHEGATGNGEFCLTTGPLLLSSHDPSPAEELVRKSSDDKPLFDEDTGELSFREHVLRSYCPRATNCLLVLKVFAEEGWPRRIDDPLPIGKNAQRISNTIRALNKKLRVIEFYAGGDRASFCWRVRNKQG